MKLISSDLARARTAEIATAAAIIKTALDDWVWRAYVELSYKYVFLNSVLPLPASWNTSDGTQQPTRSVLSAICDILMRSDDPCTEGVRAPAWVPVWTHPLKLILNRDIAPDRPTTTRITTLIDVSFGQVSRGMDDGASEPKAFTLLLRLFLRHFDRVDTRKGYTMLLAIACYCSV